MYGKIKKIHFVGIGGIGMSGIAEVLNNMGYEISGSDLSKSSTTERLNNIGVKISIGHSSDNVLGTDVVVTSSAIKEDNPEVISAKDNNIPVIPRAEMLAELMRLKYGIAVIGSHGKTTTTSLVSSVLRKGNFDPTIVVGGKVKTLGSNAHLGKGDFMVVEADESDGSFQRLSPVITVLTNIDNEHLDHYENIDNLIAAFSDFIEKIPFYGMAVLCIDCPRVRELASKSNKRFITYGFNKDADLYLESLEPQGFNTKFNVIYKGKELGAVVLNVPGKHNALNSLAAIAIGIEMGMKFEEIAGGLKEFGGIDRRLQLKGEVNDVLIIDDYGHHPAEIKTTLESIEEAFSKKPIVIFQPHRFTRTNMLFNEFVEVLSKVENLYVLDIYPAGEKPINGITSRKLVDEIIKSGNSGARYICDKKELFEKVKNSVSSGDIILTSGAGNVWMHGEELLRELQ
ncbi:MAG: UDP-N-acetylmuramate--L-alanine ligase [Thermodesulfobacteriota bacterium]